MNANLPGPSGTMLARLNAKARADLLNLGVTCSFPAGHALLRQGDVGGSVYLLLDALAKVIARAENGSRALLGIRVTGDIVGEMAVLDSGRRSATVVTCGPAIVSQIKGPVFLDFLRRNADAGLMLSQMTGDRLRWANRRRLDSEYGVPVRLARVLLDLARRHGRPADGGLDIGVRLTQPELASLISASESAVHKALSDLAAHGLVRVGHRRVTILDLHRLQTFADVNHDFS